MAWSTNKGEVDIMLRFSLDEEAQRRVEQGISSIGDELKRISDVVANEQAEKQASEARIKRLKQEVIEATKVQSAWRRMQFTARALGEVSQIVAIASSAIFVGAAAWANKYVKDAKASTETVQAWRVALDGINTSQTRVGATLAQIMLPLLQKAQDLAEKGADFVEANPQLIRAGLNIAGVVAGIATIGLAASKGFKIYADIGYTLATAKQVTAAAAMETAAALQETAANTMLAAANVQVTGVPVGALAGTAGAGVAAGEVGALAVGTAAIAQGYRLNSAGRLINSATGRYVTAAQGMEVNAGTAGLGGLGGGGFVGFLKSIPLYLFGGMKDIITDVELAQKAANAEALKGLSIAESWKASGGWQGFFDTLLGKTKPVTGAIDVATGLRVGAYGGKGALPPSTATSTEYMEVFTKNNVRLFIDYQRQVSAATKEYGKRKVDLEVTYEKQRTDIVATYAKQRAAAEAAYELDTSRSMRDFALSEAQAEEDYYQSRADAATSYGEDAKRSEEDHLREMRRLLEDHNDKVEGFAATRDALGYAREMRDYERRRRDAEEEYLTEQGHRNRDFALRMRDLELQFRRERARRLQQFQQTQKDNKEDHDAQMAQMDADKADRLARLKEDYDSQIAVLKTSYEDQIKLLEEAFLLRIHDLDATIVSDYAVFQTTTAAMAIRFRAYLAGLAQSVGKSLGGSVIKKAGGGYLGFGRYTVGEQGYEFLLSHPSTRLAERLVGGDLTQNRLIAALAGSNGGSRYSDNRTMQFNGMTAKDRDWVRNMVVQVAEQTVVEAARR